VNLSTTYLRLPLDSPLMAGASPLVDDLDVVRRLEDAGSSAIVMHSLFEEQIREEQLRSFEAHDLLAHPSAEARSYFPDPGEFALGPASYLEHIRRIKGAVNIPVIASLNGTSQETWIDYARLIEEAGADALELNTYYLATDPHESSSLIESRLLGLVRHLRREIAIPFAVKLSPFFSALANMVMQLEEAGADGVILFNRFYQPDIDVERLETVPTLQLSDSSELLLRLRWLAILSDRTRLSLAASGGIHHSTDAVKAVMAGAHAVQIVSALLRRGPAYLRTLREGLLRWMDLHEYESVAQMRGSMSLRRSPDPGAFERANYMRILQARS
jgi:dihydroorotate dehydrogenase (fumarate)